MEECARSTLICIYRADLSCGSGGVSENADSSVIFPLEFLNGILVEMRGETN
jgi:hypothetical protein